MTTTPQSPAPRPGTCLDPAGERVRFIPAAVYVARWRERQEG